MKQRIDIILEMVSSTGIEIPNKVTCFGCPDLKSTECLRKEIIKNLEGVWLLMEGKILRARPSGVIEEKADGIGGRGTVFDGYYVFEPIIANTEGFVSAVGRAYCKLWSINIFILSNI